MEPGSFEPGNKVVVLVDDTREVLQWSRAHSSPETRQTCDRWSDRPRFNGAGLIRARKQNKLVAFYNSMKRFNGAGLIRARKQRTIFHRGNGLRASMEPGSFEPGNKGRCTIHPARRQLQWSRAHSSPETRTFTRCLSKRRRFNGAGLIRARKLAESTMECVNELASMEPGSFEPGNTELVRYQL